MSSNDDDSNNDEPSSTQEEDTTVSETALTILTIPDFLVDINTSKFVESNGTKVNQYNLSQYFTNATSYSYILTDTNVTADWLGLDTTTGDMNLTTNIVENNSTLLDTKHFIKITGSNSEGDISTYFALRFKDLNGSLTQYMDGNITGAVETDRTNQTDTDGRIYDEKNFKTADLNVTTKIFQDGGAAHEIANRATAEFKLPDSRIAISANGDVNTTATTINSLGDEVKIEVIGNATGTQTAIHKLLVNGKETTATSNLDNTTTTVKLDRTVETNATAPSGATLSIKAFATGNAEHNVIKNGKTSKAIVSVPGAQTNISTTGEMDTKLPISLTDTNSCGGSYYAEVVTNSDGNNITKFRNDDESCYKAPTLVDGEDFPAGSESNITKDSNNIIHIQTTTPNLVTDTQFTIE